MELKDRIELTSGLYVLMPVRINGQIVNTIVPNPNLTEEEFLSRDPYAEMIEKASEEQEFQKTVMIQRFVNEYLTTNGQETITQRRAKNNKRDILGILTSDYKKELQKIVLEYATNNNIDLFANQDRKNPIIGVMSKSEKKLADFLIENYTKTFTEEVSEDLTR